MNDYIDRHEMVIALAIVTNIQSQLHQPTQNSLMVL